MFVPLRGLAADGIGQREVGLDLVAVAAAVFLLLVAAIGGALIMAAAGTARIRQLRLSMRRGGLPPHAE